MAGRSLPYENDELEALAKHCTEEEDAAKKVERQVTKSAAAMLLESRIGEQFDAIVTGASDKGTWVRLLHPPIEGRLESGFEGMDVGHRLRVQLVRKLLGAGEYVIQLPGGSVAGHFGLAVKDYTHSTAPNRRYPDLITQRLLKAAVAGRSGPYEKDELEALAKHCTDAEDAAKKVERQVSKSAAAILLESRIGERFDAIVTGASDKGTWVRLLHPPIEGRLEIGFEGLDVGHRLRVQLVRTDVVRGYIDFKRVA